ncbi:MAG: hypothetical protein IMF08_00080 [Proteobacteria bacterium]|nr:hypothetical protein [Pseudomonadota bacterium]
MDELSKRDQAIMRATRMRWRKFKRANLWVVWAAIAVAGVSFWVGMERGFSCVDSEGIEGVYDPLDRAECTCERDGSRWRYGQCDPDPVEWSAANHILLTAPTRRDGEAGRPVLELTIRMTLRGGGRKGDSIVLRGVDARRLLGEMAQHTRGSADEPFIVMLRAWGEGIERWQFLDGGYYPFYEAAGGRPPMVSLKPRDIQIIHAKSGRPYPGPPDKVPLRDFMTSLWQEGGMK